MYNVARGLNDTNIVVLRISRGGPDRPKVEYSPFIVSVIK